MKRMRETLKIKKKKNVDAEQKKIMYGFDALEQRAREARCSNARASFFLLKIKSR